MMSRGVYFPQAAASKPPLQSESESSDDQCSHSHEKLYTRKGRFTRLKNTKHRELSWSCLMSKNDLSESDLKMIAEDHDGLATLQTDELLTIDDVHDHECTSRCLYLPPSCVRPPRVPRARHLNLRI